MKNISKTIHFYAITVLILTSLTMMARISEKLPLFARKDLSGSTKNLKCLNKKIKELLERTACNSSISFGSKEINQNGGFIIDRPGVYCLKENVIFNPSTSPFTPPNPATVQSAITIKSSNVLIDLGGHTLSQAGEGTSTQIPYCIGILIPDMAVNKNDPSPLTAGALQSIYIKGNDAAVIQGFSMFGIRVFAHTYDVHLSNLTIKDCGDLASKALRPFPSYRPHSVVDNPSFPGTNDAMQTGGVVIGETCFNGMGAEFFTDLPLPSITGIPAPRAASIVIENVSCLHNFYNGIFAAYSTDVTIKDSHFDDTWSDQEADIVDVSPNGGFFVGGGVGNGGGLPGSNDGVGVINLVVTNSTFNGTILTVPSTVPVGQDNFNGFAGFSIFDGLNGYYENCQFNETSCITDNGTTLVFGYVQGGAVNQSLISCQFNNTNAPGSVNGFHSSGTVGTKPSDGLNVTNCEARSIFTTGGQATVGGVAATGFFVTTTRNIAMTNCIASDIITSAPAAATATTRGFRLTDTANGNLENIVLRGCVAQNVRALNGGAALGFQLLASNQVPLALARGVILEDCSATGIYSTAPAPWSAAITYTLGDFVTFGGGTFKSLIQINLNNQPPAVGISNAFWQAVTVLGTTSIAGGFYLEGDVSNGLDDRQSWPWSLVNCQALHVKGPSTPATFPGGILRYSGGFCLFNLGRASLYRCTALDNIYGLIVQYSDRNAIRNCIADNNAELGTNVGGGFVDLADGTPENPGLSTSVFQNNTAFANGDGVTHDGVNGNYNIITNNTGPVREPLLAGSLSNANSFNPTISFGTYYAHLHNISTIVT